jgi:FtsZ-binding cell division protein ZapB
MGAPAAVFRHIFLRFRISLVALSAGAPLTWFPCTAYLGPRGHKAPRSRTKSMRKLDSALERFSSAVDKLEATINRQVVRAQAAKRLQEEVDALKEDRSGLAEELDQMRSEARRLNELNERASETLANAI